MYRKNRKKALTVLAAVVILGIVYLLDKGNSSPKERVVLSDSPDLIPDPGTEELCPEESTQICVFITGCVASPGVYTVPEGSRIYEVLDLAGGFSGDAEKNAVNLAETVRDGEAILIPSVTDMETAVPGGPAVSSDGRVNINTAGLEELMTLPGIGKAKAEAVIVYRKDHGNFTSVEGLMDVTGIGEGIFVRIRDKIKV